MNNLRLTGLIFSLVGLFFSLLFVVLNTIKIGIDLAAKVVKAIGQWIVSKRGA